MSLLEDTAIFAAIISTGGLAKAAQKLNISNGLVSRRLAALEKQLGVTLIKRTTRQLALTPEGELFWQHAKRIQQEMDSALCTIHALSDRPTGHIRISAPPHFGRHYLSPILNEFMGQFEDITIELFLTNKRMDPIEHNIDLLIRGVGYLQHHLPDSNMISRLLMKSKNRLYASKEYLIKHGVPQTPDDLTNHRILGQGFFDETVTEETWTYWMKGKEMHVSLVPIYLTNDMECRITACLAGRGILKYADMIQQNCLVREAPLVKVLENVDWGEMSIYAVYSQQQALPVRTRLLLDFITARTKHVV